MNNMINNLPKTESLILVPIYNEQKHIFNVLREVRNMNNMINNLPKTESLILVPIYNEQKHIFNVLREVRKYSPEDLLVVNDGSTDESKEIVDEIASCAKLKGKLVIINHLENEGYGKSLIDGINFARDNNYQYLLTLDCDEQHEPELIPQFLEEIKKGNFEIISGSRYLSLQKQIDAPPEDRYIINPRPKTDIQLIVKSPG